MAFDIKKDSAGNSYVDVGDWTRITFVPAYAREESKDWAGCAVLRIQSYRNKDTSSLHMGAEVPVPEGGDVLRFIGALAELMRPYYSSVAIRLPEEKASG